MATTEARVPEMRQKATSGGGRWGTELTPRIKRLREQYLSYKPTLSFERAVAMTEVFKETEGEAVIIRRAKALKRICETKNILIQDDELIIGNSGEKPRDGVFAPEISTYWMSREIDTIHQRPSDPIVVTDEQKALFWKEIHPYWNGKTLIQHWLAQIPDEMRGISYQSGVIDCEIKTETGAGEYAPGYAEVLFPQGWKGIREHAERKLADFDPTVAENVDKRNFLRAVVICCDAMKTLALRHAEAARAAAAKATKKSRKDELLHTAEVCEWVSENPPRTFQEALQLIWFTQIGLMMEINAPSYGPNRLDQYCWPLLRDDLEAGRITKEAAQELLECLWIKLSEQHWYLNENSARYYAGTGAFQNVTISGIDKAGNDATNPLSYMCVQASMDVRLIQPGLSVRLHRRCPEEFLHKVCELVRIGTGQPSIYNDEVGIKMIMSKGIPPEEARDWTVVGCVEPNLAGRTAQWSDYGNYSFASAIEFALFNGVHQLSGEQLGLPTGDPESFKTFDEFYDAFKQQLASQFRWIVVQGQILEMLHRDLIPCPLGSSLMLDCVESGREMTRGGARYPVGPGTLAIGVADGLNSLAAIKKLVYDDKRLTMTQLCEALAADFVGHEDVQAMCLNEVPKYGNDDDYVDDFAQDLLDFVVKEHRKYTTLHGSHIMPSWYPVSSNVPQGLAIGALPSGRKATKPLADGCSPQQGTDRCGPTAILNSVGKFQHSDLDGGTLLNLKFEPSVLAGEEGIERLEAYLRAYLDSPIYECQFNVIDRETLLDAQEHPEEYRSLLVRVAGYSAFFVELDPEIQNDIISRTWQTQI